jgi:hypothetical protein
MVTSPAALSRGIFSPPPAGQDGQRQQPYYWPQFNPVSVLPRISSDQVWQGLQVGEELIPVVAPSLSHVTPLISVGYAGKDIYYTFTNAYKKTEDLPPGKRLQKIAAETGDITLFHLFSTFLIPLLLYKRVKNWIEPKIQDNPRLPALISRSKHGPVLVTGAILTLIGLATSKPVNKGVDALLDVTYRPLVEKRKREKLIKQQKEWLKQYEKLKSEFPSRYQPYLSSFTPRYSPFYLPAPIKAEPPAKPAPESGAAAKSD